MGRHPYAGFSTLDSAADYAICMDALAHAGLSGYENRSYNELSGGEQKLALIARALAQQTDIILLDEPLAELDLRHQADVLQLMRSLTTGGKAVVASFHDLNAAARCCDRLVLLSAGELAATGAPKDVLTQERLSKVYSTPVTWSTDQHLALAQ
jgi:iron complex transport system ATP-binding protein